MVGSAFVNIVPAPKAIIHLLSDTLSVLYPQAEFISQSVGNIIEQIWNFGDNSGDLITDNPKHIFPIDQFGRGISSMYEAKLVVTDDRGCRDTAYRQIWVGEEYYMYIPNSFTPDLDGKNDKFCISYRGVREETFVFNIYSRFSELVYSTNDINDLKCIDGQLINGWDGKHQVTETDLPIGSYIYEIYYQDFEGWKHHDKEHIFIIR
jgi:gliding motility-associated-like protein